jgi:hypothetical protein
MVGTREGAPLPTLQLRGEGEDLATFSRAWKLAENVLVSHISLGRTPA